MNAAVVQLATKTEQQPPKKQYPVIGSKYNGKHQGFADMQTGVYWEAMYPITADEALLQRCILEHAAEAREKVFKAARKEAQKAAAVLRKTLKNTA